MATKTRPRTSERPSSPRQPGPRQSGPRQANPRFARVAGLQRVVKDSISEMKKITWPDKETTRNLTIVVIAISLILGLLLGGVDAAFVRLWQAMP
jgi:preprotein translocase subunit SecE